MSLIHWWPLNGDAEDKIGGKNGILNAGAVVTEAGKIGKCYSSINNASDKSSCSDGISVPGCNLVGELSSEYSFACWFKVHGTHGQYQTCIMSSGDWNTGACWVIGFDRANTKIFCPVDNYNKGEIALGYQLTNNVWYHLATVYKNGVSTAYLNGSVVGSVQATGIYRSTTANAYIGRDDAHGGFFPYNGDINDLRIYDHALSKKEVKELYKTPILHYDFENITSSLGENILKSTTLSMSNLATSVSGFESLGPGSMKFTTAGTGTTRMSIPLNLLTANQVYKFSFIVQDPSSSVTFRIGDWCDSGTITNHIVRKIGTNRYFVSANISRSAYDSTYRFMDFNVSGAGTFYLYNIQMCPVITKIMDSSGYNNDGENHGVTFTTTTPLGTKAASFASGKYIKLPDPFKSSFNEATWSMWINENGGSDTYKSIYHTYGSPTGTYWISVNTEGVPLWFYKGGYIRGKGITFTANTFHHIAITFKDGVFQWYFNGNPVTMETTVSPTSLPCSEYMSIGDSYTGTSWAGTPFTGQIADFKIYATALSANDITEEYKTRIQIARDSSLFVNRIKEDSVVRDAVFDYKMNANVNGISEYDLKNKFDGNIYEEPDGSKWIHICHHNNPKSYLFSSGNDFANSVYIDSNRWFNMEVCNYLNSWEIMVKQTLTSGGTEYKYRWVQPKNPMTAVYGDVDKADVTYNTGSEYTSTTYGGIYKNGGKAYLTANNGTNGNWWGATGCWTDYDGIPAWNGQIVSTGYYDVYVRIDNTTITDSGTNFKSFNKGTVYAKNIIEY